MVGQVDDDGIIHLDSSSSSDDDGADNSVQPPSHRARANVQPAQAARKSTAAPAKRSTPVAARKAAPMSGYDSDEHLQFVISELLSTDGSDQSDTNDSDDYDDSDLSFDEAAAFRGRSAKRKRPSSSKRLSKSSSAKHRPSSSKSKQTVAKTAKRRKTQASHYSSDDDDESSDSSDGSSTDDHRVRSKASSSKQQKRAAKLSKKDTRVAKRYARASSRSSSPEHVARVKMPVAKPPVPVKARASKSVAVLSVSSDASSSEDERPTKRPAAPLQRTKAAKSAPTTRPAPTLSRSTPQASASTGAPTPAAHRRSDLGFHELTEKLSFSELQAQRQALERLAAQHKRANSIGASSSSSHAASRKPQTAPLRLESRKNAVKASRVDEIERRFKASAAAAAAAPEPTLVIAPPPREAAVQPPLQSAAAVSVAPPLPPSASALPAPAPLSSTRSTGGSGLRLLRVDRSKVPAVHSTAWRRLQFARAPPNILLPDAAHLVPFADEFDRPLPDFDPSGTLEEKTRVLATFGQAPKITEATFAGDSHAHEEDMNERVQQLISDALPLLHACQAQRVKRVLKGTRAHLQTYFRAHEQLRAQRLHSASPHATFDLSFSERSDARRLFEHRRRVASRLNTLVGHVRYFVAHDTASSSSDSAAAPSVRSIRHGDAAAANASVLDGDVPSSDAEVADAVALCPLDERVVFPETVIQLSDDIPPMRKSWAYIGVKKNVHVADDPILRYIPYLGENTRVNIDPNRYSSTTLDKSKRVELVGSRKDSVFELKSVVASALDDETMEYLLRYVVRACGDSKRVFEALQAREQFAQPYSDYCEIKKNDDARRRLLKRITGMQALMARTPSTAATAPRDAMVEQYVRALGGSCWFLQPRNERASLTFRLKPPIPYFESNYQRCARAGGLRRTKVYSESTEWYRDLFCRRCYTYDCDDHGILQPTPLQRMDPINPVVRRAGLALRDQPATIDLDAATESTPASQATSANVIALDVSPSSDDGDSDRDGNESVDDGKASAAASASASDDDAAVCRRSRRSQTRISSLASASLKIQEKMQEKERRRQRRAEARQLKQLTRAVDDSEYLDDSYMPTIMEAVQPLLSKDTPCSATCYKSHVWNDAVPAATDDAAPVDGAQDTLVTGVRDVAPVATATPSAPAPELNDAEVLLIRKLASTLGDNACLIAAMLANASCTCVRVSQFLRHEQQLRLAKRGDDDDDDDDASRARSASIDLSNRRRQKNDRRSSSHGLSGNRELLKRTRAQRNHDKGNKHSYQPCNHDGSCDGCECMKRDHHCNKACACPRDCPNRFQGCKCAVGTCRTKACPCYNAGRECDPDYCFACGASDAAVLVVGATPERRLNYDIGICCNTNLLRGAQRKIGISFSTTHGWGAFALEPIRKGEFLYEYTGALISDDEAERRGNIYDVMAISFLFDVNCDEVVDATRKGNKSKFANHKALEAANCEAKILLVNGEHRIALYARDDIRVGEELFFDYGYTHETAPKWSQVETRRGQRFEITRRAGDDVDLLEDFDDDDDEADDDDVSD